ncbi:MAG: T9SS type A sorting domain-containing protein [Dyadobacter sp.]|uniref:T9SS type A sorting domain-containing protein n=1 Tax=Dyadobacter sp. TaxID=1914288 RepID=UPI003265E92F
MKYFLLAIASFFSFEVFSQSLEGDRLALVALYNATNGANWWSNTGWVVPGLPGDNPCGWYGVTCTSGRVTELDLSNNSISGYLPAEIGGLSELKSLKTKFDQDIAIPDGLLGGAIPAQLGNLTKLEHLDLSGNHFTGSIPSSIGNLFQLSYLDLRFIAIDSGFDPYGKLIGSIPSEFGNLVNLKHLDLSSQNLSGNIPPELGNLGNLEFLDLANNNFSGNIPSSFGSLSKLTVLDIRYDGWLRETEFGKLGGTIPNLSGMPVSANVNISNNSFTFAGIEANISRLDYYSNQALLPMQGVFPLSTSGSSGPGGVLFVEAGGTVANNTYKWYRNNSLIETNVGDKFFNAEIWGFGIYKVVVTNSIATGLTLTSATYNVTALPVTLVYFQGKQDTGKNHLTWKTTSETNNAGFEIEKSADARTFEKIGFVDGNGDTEEDRIYHFTDLQPHRITYYRLKQLDRAADRYNGEFEYSKIIMVKQAAVEISIYPNPAQNQLTISGLRNCEYVSIFSQNGILVSKQFTDAKGNVEMESLTNGIYTIKIGDKIKKIVIQR